MQKNTGKFFLKNIKSCFADSAWDIEKEKEINDFGTFRLSPNLLVFI